MALPEDPAAFIAAAERGINDYDLDATAGVYAPEARLEAITDGAREVYSGAAEIRAGWDGYLRAMRDRRFTLSKRLLSAEGDLIVNEWSGSLGARTDAEGIEWWRFDSERRVLEHRMLSFLAVRESTSPLARLLLALSYPLGALAFLRRQRETRR